MVGSVQNPSGGKQAVIFDFEIATRKAGCELVVRVLHQLLIDLHFVGRADGIRLVEMRLILTAGKKFSRQDLTIEVGDLTFVVGGSGGPEGFAIRHGLEFQECPAESDSAGKAVSRMV